jgi:hypothetical protein
MSCRLPGSVFGNLHGLGQSLGLNEILVAC